jgi:hypothetical protein
VILVIAGAERPQRAPFRRRERGRCAGRHWGVCVGIGVLLPRVGACQGSSELVPVWAMEGAAPSDQGRTRAWDEG